MNSWRPDILGNGFEYQELTLGEDFEGEVVATLVRSLPAEAGIWQRITKKQAEYSGIDVLYVHGWNDYFFQKGHAEFWTGRGANFYALDLRKYGRSFRAGQTPGYVEDLTTYDEEISLAIELIRGKSVRSAATPPRKLILVGHSTGGLVLSLWSARHKGEADGLILNSPWLEFQLSGTVRKAIAPVIGLRARVGPHEHALPQFDLGFYAQAQGEVSAHADFEAVNHEWRPLVSPPIVAGWLNGILAGHATVASGINVGAPVCVLLSARSVFGVSWKESMAYADTVLDVDGIAKAALKLGPSVTIERIEGALHDVFLSAPEIKEQAYLRMEAWMRGWLANQVN